MNHLVNQAIDLFAPPAPADADLPVLAGSTVWVLHISHRHGDNVSVHLSERDAQHAMATFAREWWSEVAGRDGCPDNPPTDDVEAARLYFQVHQDETATMTSATVEGMQTTDGDTRTVTVGGVAAKFTGDELDCLARTAGEVVAAGDIHELSAHQRDLALRAYKAHVAEDLPGDIDMDAVAAEVKARGQRAHVEQTGGGTATIYAGRQARDEQGDMRWSAAAGPGWFKAPGYRQPRADTLDFYIGPDDDGQATPLSPPAGASAEEIAEMIVAVIEQDTRPQR